MRHLIDPLDFTKDETEELLVLAEDIRNNPEKYQEKCKHKKIATLFYEPSTRTRLSFESAMINLGGSVIGFSSANSSSIRVALVKHKNTQSECFSQRRIRSFLRTSGSPPV